MLAETVQEWTVKWKQEGRDEGHKEGHKEGRKESLTNLIRKLATRRFGPLPDWAGEKLDQATPETLESWGEALLDAKSLEEIFARQ